MNHLAGAPTEATQVQRSRNFVLLLFLVGTTLLVSTVAIASYKIVRGLFLSTLQQKVLSDVKQGGDEIDEWLAVRRAEMQTLASSPVLQSLDWSIAEPYLKSEQQRLPDFQLFVLAAPDGSYFNTKVGRAKVKVNDRKYFQKAMAGQLNVADPVISRTTGVVHVLIGAPVRPNAQTYPQGVLAGAIPVDRVAKVVGQLHQGPGSYAFALNSKGVPIVHPDRQLMGTQERPAPSLVESAHRPLSAIARNMVIQKQGIELIQLDGQWRYVAYAPLQHANWSIALVMPKDNLESQLQALDLLASVLGGLLVVAMVGGWRQAKLFAQRNRAEAALRQNMMALQQSEADLRDKARQLEQTLRELRQTQSQVIQSEKMSSLGQLVAGVAHEINNPISFIYGNLTHATEYTHDLVELLRLYQRCYPTPCPQIEAEAEAIDLPFLVEDLPRLLASMRVGAERIQSIVLSLRNFSRMDEADMKSVDIHEGIDSTLMILQNRLKPKPEQPAICVIKEYSSLPLIDCYAGQLNQVFMNILNNAIDALNDLPLESQNGSGSLQNRMIRICTEVLCKDDRAHTTHVLIRMIDNGPGIPEAIQPKLFDPFFTTKPVGKGTGLGLSVSYQIVTERHGGSLRCISTPGEGTEFAIEIPIKPQFIAPSCPLALNS